MDTHDHYDAFLDEATRLAEERLEARQVIEDAREAFAPAPLGPDPDEQPRGPAPLVRWLGELGPDRLVTYPLWAMAVAAIHLLLLILLVGVVVTGGALILCVASVVDALIGFPLARPGAWAIAALASVGTFVTVFESFKAKIRQFPW